MGDDPAFHRAWAPSFFPHASQGNLPKVVASLDNSIYFHSYDFRADEWLLYEASDSPPFYGGRGVSFGKLWKQDGTLIATTSQEILARFARKSKL
ncbi:Acyl-coenzyme A thioesterase 8-like [Aphelenchoides fujianensis]|nr:Acyl-coenzyme A thioesterase 8-like [Aphelenchoides fujianensis]